jgi:hypothetical protein
VSPSSVLPAPGRKGQWNGQELGIVNPLVSAFSAADGDDGVSGGGLQD